MQVNSRPWLLLFFSFAILGCSGDSQFVAAPESLVGTLDTSLPADSQRKQQAVARFLCAMQEGVGDAGQLQLVAPGIRYADSFEAFFEGAGRLARWEFDGAPAGNTVAVKLYFDERASGPIDPANLKLAQRTYLVTAAGKTTQIAIAKDKSVAAR
jgi:hypothetical protein